MLSRIPAFVVAGTRSGCGKTSLCLAIMAALRKRGLKVAPFKTGPDFIDPGFHRFICGRPSHNLDTWMMPEEKVRQVYQENIQGCDAAVIEGAMGLFDGATGASEKGSSAHVAKVLQVPVVLVVDASSMGRSLCALLKGYLNYDKELKFAGVIVNKAGSKKHRRIINDAIGGLDLPFLAVVSRKKEVSIPSRHLGLVTAMEQKGDGQLFEGLLKLIEGEDFDLDCLIRQAARLSGKIEAKCGAATAMGQGCPGKEGEVKIAVAYDRAFCFYYERNLDILRRLGSRLHFFSPLKGETMPADASGLYIGGGYPELYAQRLSENRKLNRQIIRGVELGLPVLAECGGFMFLGKGLRSRQGDFKWCGLFPSWFQMADRFQALGYRQVTLETQCLLGTRGLTFKGHEFRYSVPSSVAKNMEGFFTALDSYNEPVSVPAFIYKNVFASYIHIHFESNRDTAANFVERCRKYAQGDFKT